MNKTISLSLPENLILLIEEVKEKRQDPTRSDTVRILLLRALAQMSFLQKSTKKALGLSKRLK